MNPKPDQNQGTGKAGSLDQRDFESRLGAARIKHGLDRKGSAEAAEIRRRGMGAGFRIATEIVAAMIVGCGGGIAIDRWLDIAPWGLVVGLVLGSGAAFMNVMRTSQELDRQAKLARQLEEADKD